MPSMDRASAGAVVCADQAGLSQQTNERREGVMSSDRSSRRRHAFAEIDEAIIRAEMQIVLLQSALVMRAAAGRAHEGLNALVDRTRGRLATLEAERRRMLAKR